MASHYVTLICHREVIMISSRRLRLFGGLTTAALLLTAARAPDAGTERAVAAYLAAHPGGERIGGADISYDHGRFVVTVVAPPGLTAAPDCPSGWFCFYDGVNYGYPRGRLSDCGFQDLGWWGWRDRTESAAY